MNGHRLVQRGAALCLALFASIVLTMLTATPAQAEWGLDKMENAATISVNQNRRATSIDSWDTDWYKFSIAKQGVVQITFSNQQDSDADWSVKLTDASGEEIDDYDAPATTSSRTYTKIGLPAGTYYVKVYGDYDAEGLWYDLLVSYTASTSWETELNDRFEYADTISTGRTVYGSTREPYEYDWYKFSISKPGMVQLSFSNQQASRGGWDVTLTDANTKEITSYDFDATTASRLGGKIGLPAGTYYVKVYSDYNSHGLQYNFKVNYTASSNWETELNNVFENADPITLGKTIYASSMDGYEKDWFKFSLSKTTKVQVFFNNDQHSDGRWTVTLTDSNAKEISSYRFDASNKGGSTPTMTLSKGTYYIEVYPNYACDGYNYNLRVAQPSQTRTMYRLYNRYTGEHFYTASATERDSLRNSGWTYEGTGWIAPTSGTPVYRLYNPWVDGGDHHYTTSVSEYDALGRLGWRKEGVGWYSGGSVKVYRQYNRYATTGTHNYTTSKAENDALVRLGWRAEGVGWYAVRAK